jgi:hypothetical protein
VRSPVSLRIVVLQHEPETGLGAFAAVLDQAYVDNEIVETLSGRLPARGYLQPALDRPGLGLELRRVDAAH